MSLPRARASKFTEVSLSTMWAKGRFSHMAEFASKARELGFTQIEANASVSPPMLDELIKAAVPISSIHSPCPALLSSTGIPADSLSLSSLSESERTEAVDFTRRTIDLAANVGARAVVLHMGAVPVDLGLQERMYDLCGGGYTQTQEYGQVKEKLVHQRMLKAPPCLDAARTSLTKLAEHTQQKGIILGLETRFHFNEIPDIDEMAELLNEVPQSLAGYWHDVGHAEVQQRLGFASHEEWLSRFKERTVGVHLHDIRGISDHQAPGYGNVNWEMVADYLPAGSIRVCEIGEWTDEERLRGVAEFLRKKGILN